MEIEFDAEDIKQFIVHPVRGYPQCQFHLTEVAELEGLSNIKCDRLGTRCDFLATSVFIQIKG
jgi:hypothetical protein